MTTTVRERPIVSSHARKDAAPATAEERAQPSYVSGASTPLAAGRVGSAPPFTAQSSASVPARRSCRATRGCATATPSWPRRSRRWRAGCWPWALSRASGSGSGRPTAPSGRSCSSPPPSWGSFSSTSSAYRTSELEFALRQSGCRALVAARAFKSSDYVAMVEEVRPKAPTLEQNLFLDGPDWHASASRRRGGERGRGPEVRPRRSFIDPSTCSTRAAPPAFPRRPHSATTTSSTTPTSSGAAAGTARRTGSASPCPSTTASAWSWATWRRSRTAPAWSSRSRLRRGRGARDRAAGALHVALRRTDALHRRLEDERFAAFDLTRCAPASWPARRARSTRAPPGVGAPPAGGHIAYGLTESSPGSTERPPTTLERRARTIGRPIRRPSSR